MRRILIALTAFATCAASAVTVLVVSTPSAGLATPSVPAVVTARATSGAVGPYAFPAAAATCAYSQGRLSAITFAPARAAGRRQWEPTGQWVLWGARLQARTGSGPWRGVGGTHYSDAKVKRFGSPEALPRVSIPRIYGAANTRYRVVQTISWYFNNRRSPIVQGQATRVVNRYAVGGVRERSCAGTTAPRLPTRSRIRNDELDRVRVSFAASNHSSRMRYAVSGALPRGLRLNRDTGVVSGTVSVRATNATTTYRTVRSTVLDFRIAATAGGRTTTRSYSWVVFDTAFVMPDYFNRYGCGQCGGNPEPVRNISQLGPKFAFGCTDERPDGITRDGVIYRQDFQREDGKLRPSAGRTFRYGDVFKWWYYPCSA